MMQRSIGTAIGALLLFVPVLFAADPQSLSRSAEVLAVAAEQAVEKSQVLPPDLYPAINAARSVTQYHSEGYRRALAARLQGYQQELEILTGDRDSIGRSIVSSQPVALFADSEAELVQTYSVGSTLAPGAAILAARHWSWFAPLQNVDPAASNFVIASVPGRTDVSLRPVTIEREGVHGGLAVAAPLPGFEVAGGSLRTGDQVILRYQRVRLPTQAVSEFPLPLYLRFERDGHWFMVPGTSLVVQPQTISRIHAAIPHIARRGDPVSIQMRLSDRFGNLAGGSLPPFDVLVDGQLRTRVPAGTDPLPSIGITFETTGLREVEIRSAGGGLRTSAQVIVEDKPASFVHWVELHAPTNAGLSLLSTDEVRGHFSGLVDAVVPVDQDGFMTPKSWRDRTDHLFDGFVWSGDLIAGGHLLVLSSTRLSISTTPRESWPTIGALVRDDRLQSTLKVALPGVPADQRFLVPGAVSLVEIQSGRGSFEWYANRLASRGVRVGFSGSAHGHHAGWGQAGRQGRTAVITLEDEPLFDALRAGRTYVTTGARMYLDVSVNGGRFGERVAGADVRQISGRVIGTAGIDRIELLRNGEVVATRDLARSTDSQRVRVSFNSASNPLNGQMDLPRNGREWIGFVRAVGADIVNLQTPGFQNDARQAAAINPRNSGRVDFITWTQGASSSILFDVTEDVGEVTLEAVLGAGYEDHDQRPLTRSPAEIPAARFMVTLSELSGGPVRRQVMVEGYEDTVTFELVQPETSVDVTFEFSERRPYGAGDYYYVRVLQRDDHVAWGSPVWVGGYDNRQVTRGFTSSG